MKKLLLAALAALSINTVAAAGERTAQGDDIYNPNNYRVEYDAERQLVILIPDYFIQVYRDEPLEKYIPMYFHGELFPLCIECIYRYYYYDDNNNKIYLEADTDIYNINGKYYISIREEEVK